MLNRFCLQGIGAGWLARRQFCVALVFSMLLMPWPVQASASDPDHPDISRHFFSELYRQIHEYYIEPVSVEDLALAGLGSLTQPDGSFVVTPSAKSILFTDHGQEIERLARPEPNDASGWAQITRQAIIAGRAHVASLANLDDEQTYKKIFEGIAPRLDRFTRYAGSDQARDQRASRDGFGGIGVTLDYTDPLPRVSSVIADGPAAIAGIKIDDRLLAIDGVPISSLKQHDVVDRLRGAISTPVVLTLQRDGRDGPMIMTITRALVVPPTVTAERLDDIAVFHISIFNHNTADSLLAALNAQNATPPTGVILDLRNNPGGLLDQAVSVAETFLDSGMIVSSRGRYPTASHRFEATEHDRTGGVPMVVLVNGGSASSSEIVASALQDDGRALVVGSSSYGKGTVQMVLTLENEGELTLTWARLFTPGGYLLHTHGIVPAFCTSRPLDPLAAPESVDARVQTIIERGLHPANTLELAPRANLAEADWTQLRKSCPTDPHDSDLDLPVARRLLREPGLYAAALSHTVIAHAALAHAVRSPLQ